MLDVLRRAADRRAAGVRLLQSAYHSRSLSLYATLGFTVRDVLACMQGTPPTGRIPGHRVRRATTADLSACAVVCRRVHGHDRTAEMADAIAHGTGLVVEHDGRISGYASDLGFAGHAVGESDADLKALILAADTFHGSGILVPITNGELFRWCLEQGLHIVHVMTLAPHRRAAFEGAEFLMDYLKTDAPFWKQETDSQGTHWVEAKTADDAAKARWE